MNKKVYFYVFYCWKKNHFIHLCHLFSHQVLVTFNFLKFQFTVASCLKPPIPRNIWTYVVEKTPVDKLLECLSNKRLLISLDGGSRSIFASERRFSVVEVFRKYLCCFFSLNILKSADRCTVFHFFRYVFPARFLQHLQWSLT